MDTRSLEAFAAVYECGSIAKAAERLYISPQGLAKAITRLESELGRTLFVRDHQGATPTSYARALYPQTQELKNILLNVSRDADTTVRPTLHVYSTSGVYAYVGPAFARDFEAAHNGLSIALDEGSDEYVSSLIVSGLAEVAFLASPVDPDLFEAIPFSSHPHVLVVGLDDPLANKNSVTFSDLNGRRVATLCGGYSPNRGIRSRLAAKGIVPSSYVGYAESYTGFLMAAHGEAVCINTDYAAALNMRPDVRVLPFSDPSFTWETCIAWRKDVTLGPAARAFVDFASLWIEHNKNRLFKQRTQRHL